MEELMTNLMKKFNIAMISFPNGTTGFAKIDTIEKIEINITNEKTEFYYLIKTLLNDNEFLVPVKDVRLMYLTHFDKDSPLSWDEDNTIEIFPGNIGIKEEDIIQIN